MNKEQIKHGDILESDTGTIACVRKVIDSGIRVWINNEKDIILNEQLHHWKFANPIKGNRIVSGKTFAVRFKQFLEWVPKKWWMSQPHYYEEYEYLMYVAQHLLDYQIQTAKDELEIDYLKRLGLL